MIDHLLALDPGQRGIARFFVRGGAAAAARSLSRGKRTVLTTGFTVAPNQPETDGPPGTAVLGRALRLLGHKVTYVTDGVMVPILETALDALGEPTAVLAFDAVPDAAAAARRVLASESPTHLVSIERPGRTRDGDYRNARGVSVKPWNLPLDALFLTAPRRVVTVGIGDGGNEIGMGNVRARILRTRALAPSITSVVKVRHLVHSADEEGRMVEACVAAGAVDGISRRRDATVDGLPLAAHIGMLELLRLFIPPMHTGGPTR
jgi:D-glutamate cyclase-like protein